MPEFWKWYFIFCTITFPITYLVGKKIITEILDLFLNTSKIHGALKHSDDFSIKSLQEETDRLRLKQPTMNTSILAAARREVDFINLHDEPHNINRRKPEQDRIFSGKEIAEIFNVKTP